MRFFYDPENPELREAHFPPTEKSLGPKAIGPRNTQAISHTLGPPRRATKERENTEATRAERLSNGVTKRRPELACAIAQPA